MVGVIKALNIMPCQIMPAVWKIVYAIDSICKKHELEITIEDLKYLYSIKTAGTRRFTFKARNTNQVLIRKMLKEDGLWKFQFMFFKAETWNAGIDFTNFKIREKGITLYLL